MTWLVGVYGANAVAFLANFAAIAVYGMLAGPAGYGTYGIYVVFAAVYQVLELALVKTALTIWENDAGERNPLRLARAVGFLYGALLPISALSVPFIVLGDQFYPYHHGTGVGGSFVLAIAFCEHLFSYPAIRVTFQLILEKRFRAVHVLRLGATLLRHLFGWSVLWLTGSITWAIAAILLKGVVTGVACQLWLHRSFRIDAPLILRPMTAHFGLLASLFATAFVLIVMQELPTIYIDRVYGRDALGRFRVVYDVVAVVWFVATIYPTVLFSHLLTRGTLDQKQPLTKLTRLSDVIGTFHLCYFLGVATLITVEKLLFGKIFSTMAFALGVVGGVSILGYNRLLIEAAQAFGQPNFAVVSTAATTGLVFVILLAFSGSEKLPEVGWAWLFGQTALMLMLKATLSRVNPPTWASLRDILIVPVPITAFVVLDGWISEEVMLALLLVAALFAGLALLYFVVHQRGLSDMRLRHLRD